MLKHFISILLFSLVSPFLYAQKPDFIKVEPFVSSTEDRAMCNNNAGSSTQTLTAASQSNDKTFLCKNDVLNIKHNGTFDLSGDPGISTKPGLGYAFYTCKPTIAGTMLSQIITDPCIFKGNPGNPPSEGLFVVAQGKLDGNQSFVNNGFLQTEYNSGKPIKFTFAPITFDALTSSGTVKYEGTPAGSCVNVNTAASFDVVYLNAINNSIVSQGNGTGSFKLFGGLSEYDNNQNYTITIQSAGGATGTVTSGAAKHGGTVVFTAPNGVYTVTVEDGKSCGTTFNMTLSAAFDVVAVGDTICDAASPKKGSFTVIPSGGTAPFSFLWQEVGGAISSSVPLTLAGSVISNLDPATYTITATDAAGLKTVKTVKIVESKDITGIIYSATLSESDPTCPKSTNGSMTANVVGGFSPFFYQWDSDGGIGKNAISGLSVGTYNVTITDNIGCAIVRSSGLSAKQITIANQIIKNSTCSGVADGEISITAGGGTSVSGNYKFVWAAPINLNQTVKTSTATNLKEGKYCVSITDDNGCESDFCYDVLPGKILSMTPQITDIKCFGDKTGKIALQPNTANGPAATPYIFAYTSPLQGIPNGSNYEQLPAGKYSVTMSDQDGCSVSIKDIEVKEPKELKILNVTVSDPTCTGAAKDGFIEIKAEGGTIAAGNNYKYKWDNNKFTAKITDLIAGNYEIVVTDDNGCVASKTITLTPPASPKITAVTVKNVDCSNSTNGSIKIDATPAAAGDVLTYNWSASGKSGTEIFDLPPTKYSVTVSDQKGCTATIDTSITSPAPLALVDSIITKPVCTGDKNGSITLEMTGGTPSYKFLWNQDNVTKEVSGLNKATLTDLAGGVVYTISVEDSKGCKGAVYTIFLPQPIQIKVAFSEKKDILCANSGAPNGAVKCTVTQGNIPNVVYSFTWSNNNTDTGTESVEDGLESGMARVTVTDGVCTIVDSTFIGAPEKVGLDSAKLVVTNESCVGTKDGSITVQGIGGVAPYKYLWPDLNNVTTPTVSNLIGGFNPMKSYKVIIEDANGCSFEKIIDLGSPDTLKAVKDYTLPTPSKNPSCFGYTDGVIKLLVTGGNAPYSFEWKNTNATNNIATKLSVGDYSVVITDQKGCKFEFNDKLEQPDAISFVLDTILSPICFGYLTDVKIKSAKGGTGSMLGNYTYTVDDGGDANAKDGVIPIYAGKHSVKVFDPDGCFAEQTIEIQDPPAIRVNLGPDVELELGDSYEINAVIDATAPLVKYDWTPTVGLTFSDSCKNDCAKLIKPLEDGSFILLVTDTIGCTGADTVNVSIDRNRNVYLPNIFSPNVDGTNDFMEVFADPESVEKINYFKIFDRWGNLVFESGSFKPADSRVIGNRWDGFYQDIKANTGIYTYICEVKFVDNVVLRFRGDVSLVR